MKIKNKWVFPLHISNGSRYVSTQHILRGTATAPSLISCTQNVEKQIEEQFCPLYQQWTAGKINDQQFLQAYDEMAKKETVEAKVYKAIDSLEALIQHNISDLSTWIPKEYELNKTYGYDKVAFSEYLTKLRDEIKKDTFKKIGE